MIRVAIVGSGPSGLFSAAELLKRRRDVAVDVFDRLPTPFGLVRYGVAPDHLRIKSVSAALAKVFDDPRAQFYGNVELGVDIRLAALREAYDIVILAVGAARSRALGVPGEELAGSFSASDIVPWYNGHPYARDPRLANAESVAIVGAGNVTLDLARMLLKAGSVLAGTDIPDAVGKALDGTGVRTVHIVIRRGPADVKFSLSELMELETLDDTDLILKNADPDDGDTLNDKRSDLFRKWDRSATGHAGRRVVFHFWRSPGRLLGRDRVEGIRLRDTDGDPAGRHQQEDLEVQMVIGSIGYYTESPDESIPFDDELGRVLHVGGRVANGLYVVGWSKRGPSGVIGTNKACAIQTVSCVLDDLGGRRESVVDPARRADLVAARLGHEDARRRAITWQGWNRIDQAEVELGAAYGRERTKITDPDLMIEIGTQSN